MRARRAIVPALVVLVVATGAIVPSLALGDGTHAAPDANAAENTTGVELTAYMQSTAAETNASVETGMWVADINHSANPDNKIRAQAASLEKRLQSLHNRTEVLNRMRANGTLPPVDYNARAASVRAEIAGIQESIQAADTAAERFGVNVTKLDDLRANASNMTGPEVAAIARNLTTHGPPPWAGNGTTPGDGGPPEDPGNETTPGDGGPPDDPGDGGPPDDSDSDSGSGDGSDGDAGNGNSGGSNGSGAGDGGDGGDAGDGGDGGDGGPKLLVGLLS